MKDNEPALTNSQKPHLVRPESENNKLFWPFFTGERGSSLLFGLVASAGEDGEERGDPVLHPELASPASIASILGLSGSSSSLKSTVTEMLTTAFFRGLVPDLVVFELLDREEPFRLLGEGKGVRREVLGCENEGMCKFGDINSGLKRAAEEREREREGGVRSSGSESETFLTSSGSDPES